MPAARIATDPAAAPPACSIMAALKAETSDAHAAVERRVDFDRLTSSRHFYRQTLEAFYGFYEAIERTIADSPVDGLDFVPEVRTPRLAADLRALDADLAGIPRCRDLPALGSLPKIVGALYVLEGAALGGRVISRRLAETLGIDAATGGCFFHGAGDRTGVRWREFGRAAEAAVPAADHGDAVTAARETFSAFEGWLARCDESNGKDERKGREVR